MFKVSARWVPRMLSPFQKDTRRQCCQENLKLLNEDPEHFFQSLVTGDETWVYHRDPESKMESMQWKYKSFPIPKKFRVEISAGKVMATVFWDEKGLLLLEFMPQKTTITGQTYANQLPLCEGPSKRKGEENSQKVCVLLLHDNAPVHVCKISSCHLAMWAPTAKSPTLRSKPSSLGLFSIPSYEKISSE